MRDAAALQMRVGVQLQESHLQKRITVWEAVDLWASLYRQPLDGAHLTVECESCHLGGVFQGTPFQCSSCHSTGGRVQASAKPVEHVLSTNVCEDCHRTAAWSPLREMNHDAIFGSCTTCHNNVQSAGMPPGHVQTRQQCDTCHRTTGWLPALFFDHAGVTGACAGCHNGVGATGNSFCGNLCLDDRDKKCAIGTIAFNQGNHDRNIITRNSARGAKSGARAFTNFGSGANNIVAENIDGE